MLTLENYALESYQIWDDPDLIAIEATIEGSLGKTKIARKEKRLMAAAQAGDDKAVQEIKEDIDEDLERVRKAARAEKNKQLAACALKVAAVAATITKLIINHKRDVATKGALQEIMKENHGELPPDVKKLLEAQNKHGGVMLAADVVGQLSEPFQQALGVIL